MGQIKRMQAFTDKILREEPSTPPEGEDEKIYEAGTLPEIDVHYDSATNQTKKTANLPAPTASKKAGRLKQIVKGKPAEGFKQAIGKSIKGYKASQEEKKQAKFAETARFNKYAEEKGILPTFKDSVDASGISHTDPKMIEFYKDRKNIKMLNKEQAAWKKRGEM